MNEIAVVSCITGNKDTFKTPNKFENCDYYMFTYDDVTSDIWDIYRIPRNSYSHNKNAMEVKHLIHRYLPQYKYWLWVDGSMTLIRNPNELIASKLEGYDIVCQLHPARQDIRDEIEESFRLHLIDVYDKDAQYLFLEEEGFPRNFGLAGTGIMLRRNDQKTREFNELWWKIFNMFGPRDQLSFDYCRWKLGFNWNTVPYLDGQTIIYHGHAR